MRVPLLKYAYLLVVTLSSILLYDLYSTLTTSSCETEDCGIIIPGEDQMFWGPLPTVQQKETTEPPCSLRKAVRNNSLLENSFRFSVPVFQWAGSFSNHTWEQLQARGPPYGWKGLPFNDVRLALSLLNSSHIFDRGSPGRCVRCAVVGNGGILRGSKQGKTIDDHDFVFRVNGAVTKGFEEDVGMKTSFYVFTMNTMKNALKMYKKDGFTETPHSPDVKYIFIATCLRDYVMIAAAIQNQTVPSGFDKGDRPSRYFGHKPPESFKILHPEFISYVTHSFLNSHWMTHPRHRHVYRPSTGALMLLTALHTCDQVSAYGFITKNYPEFSDHYYDSVKKPLILYANHDMKMESKLWEDLHLKRVMKLHQRTASSSHRK